MEPSTDDIGFILKERREELGLSLQDVAGLTRIRKVYLEEIEANNFSALPGKTYITGFIDVYARCLGLNSKSLLASEQVADLPEIASSLKAPTPEKFHSQATIKVRMLKPFLGLAILAVAVALGYYFFLASGGEVKNALEPSIQQGAKMPEQAEEEPPPSVQSMAASELAMDEKQPDLSSKEDIPHTIEVKEKKMFPEISLSGSSLRMLALDKGSLIITIDGRKPIKYLLDNGLDLTWKTKASIDIQMNPAGVANFWLDEEPLDVDSLDHFSLKPRSEEE